MGGVKRILRALAFLPMRMATAYSRLLSRIRSDWGYSWNDMLSTSIANQTTEVFHGGGNSRVRMRFYTPNSVCRFRASTFSSKEPETLEWIDRYGGNGAFFDVGANIGLYSVHYAKTHPGNVYAFEPSVLNLGLLAKNLSINGLSDRAVIVPNPLTSRNQIADFHMSILEEGEAMSTFGERFGHDGQLLNEQMRYRTTGYALDFLMDAGILPEVPSLMKIDVDGIEHLILRGAVKLLANATLRTILIEVNDDFIDLSTNVRDSLLSGGFVLSQRRHAEMFEGGAYAHSYNQIWVRSV